MRYPALSCVILRRGYCGSSSRLNPSGSDGDFVGGVQDPELDMLALLNSNKLVHCRMAWNLPHRRGVIMSRWKSAVAVAERQ